jgi:multidrug efflux pump
VSIAAPFVERPVASALVAVAIVLLGALAWRMLPVAPLPEIDFPSIQVSASLPGSSPEAMARTVATPLERSLGAIAGVAGISSSSSQGSSRIQLEFELGRDINAAARDVQAAINASAADLPAGMPSNPSFVKTNPSQAPVMALALSSATLTPGELYDLAASVLSQKLSQVSGVGEVTVDGSSLPAIRVQLDPKALAHYGISLDTVRQFINDTNSLRPRGTLESRDLSWQVETSDQLRHADDYAGLILRWNDGAAVRLGDVATVSESVENRYASGFHNDQPAVVLTVSRQPGANIIETVDALHAQLPALRDLLPGNAALTVVLDRSPGIRATLAEAHLTLLIAVALVVLVVLVFLGSFRAALIPTLAIPVSLVGSFVVMYLFGFSLNNISLMALIVAATLVVDDAIVVLENINRHIQRGTPPLQAARDGAAEVGFTLVAMTLALAVVFIAILFMGGLVERLFREFSITLVAAMLLSLVVSLTLTPALCAQLLKPVTTTSAPGKIHAPESGPFAHFARLYAAALSGVLRFPLLMLLMLAGVVAASLWLYNGLPKGMLPQQDTGQLTAFARGDDGFSFQIMQPKIEVYRQVLLADPAVADVIGFAGGDRGAANAQLMVRLKPRAERGESGNAVILRLRDALPPIPGGAMFIGMDQDLHIRSPWGQGGDHELMLLGSDSAELQEWARRVTEAMEALPELTEVDGGREGRTAQMVVDIDRETARRLGVDTQLVASLLNNSFSQRQVATLYDRLNQYRVVMEVEPRYTQDPESLHQLEIITADDRRVPLSAFTRIDYGLVDDRVRHQGQFAASGISFSLAEGVSLDQGMAAIDAAMAALYIPNDIHTRMGGAAQGFQNSVESQPLLILAAIVAVYLVLGVLYESLVHPLTILSTVPPAGVGALLALKLTGTEFSLIALLGLFLLIGVVMKNAILMIDFAIAAERRDGLSPRDAIIEAAKIRLRPILMTNLAGLLGALPLVLSMGEGAEMRQPLGIAIVGGLAVSQLLTLFTTPAVYLCLDRLRLFMLRRFGRHAPV